MKREKLTWSVTVEDFIAIDFWATKDGSTPGALGPFHSFSKAKGEALRSLRSLTRQTQNATKRVDALKKSRAFIHYQE